MLIEHGLNPQIPGMEVSETLIEETLRYNPECPCRTRTCPQHGFCQYCVQHHRALAEQGGPRPEHPPLEEGEYFVDHSKPVCRRIPREEIGRREGLE